MVPVGVIREINNSTNFAEKDILVWTELNQGQMAQQEQTQAVHMH